MGVEGVASPNPQQSHQLVSVSDPNHGGSLGIEANGNSCVSVSIGYKRSDVALLGSGSPPPLPPRKTPPFVRPRRPPGSKVRPLALFPLLPPLFPIPNRSLTNFLPYFVVRSETFKDSGCRWVVTHLPWLTGRLPFAPSTTRSSHLLPNVRSINVREL